MKNKAERTPRDRNEKRRLLLNKNYELSNSLGNKKLPKARLSTQAGSAVARQDGAVLRTAQTNRMRAMIALFVAIALLISGLLIGLNLHGKADETDAAPHLNDSGIRYNNSNVTDIKGLHLNKTVEKIDDDTYNVKLEAYAEANTIRQPITDIVMELDVSKRMGTELYTRNYKNLNTHTLFVPISKSDATYNHMHDKDNPFNSASIDISNSYSSNKYIKDPNTPGVYVYLASRYYIDFAGENGVNTYEYTFTDSLGNVYKSDPISKSIADSVTDSVDTIHFHRVGTKTGDAVDEVDISDFYQRNNAEKNALTSELVKYAGTRGSFGNTVTERSTGRRSINFRNPFTGKPVEIVGADTNITVTKKTAQYSGSSLWIYSDSGEKLPVTVTVEQTNYKEEYNGIINHTFVDKTYISKYIFTAEDTSVSPTKVYQAVQGNSQYGADFGVFQGFKVYKYLKTTDPEAASMIAEYQHDEDGYLLDENGDKILVVDHNESIESKSLYTSSTGESVSRMQAMKEEAERFITQLHVDAFHKNPNLTQPNVRLSVIPYGLDANPLCDLPDVNLSNEVDSIYIIDKIYALSPSDRDASQLDEAMVAAKKQFDNYSKEEPNHVNHIAKDNDFGEENKKISILFSSGVPSAETYKGLFIKRVDKDAEKELNQSVADAAIATANSMKSDLGVLSYTVGLFNGASTDPDDKHGDLFDYGANAFQFHVDKPCHGNVGEIWGSTSFADLVSQLKEGNVIDVDIPATNRVMDYISSNYSDVSNLGLQKKDNWNPRNYIFSSGGTGYKILNNYTPSAEGHYFAIDYEAQGTADTLDEQMQAIFDQIAESVEIPSTTLGVEDLLVDYITDAFEIVNTTENPVKAYMQSPDDLSDLENSTWTTVGGPLTPVVDGNKVSVDGFDYMNYNMLRDDARKLVLEFDIKRKDGLIGGNNIPTNTSTAGVYDVSFETDNNGNPVLDDHSKPIVRNTVLEEAFRVPYVDLTLKEGIASVNDDSIYIGSAVKLEDLFDPEVTDGFSNRYVKIEYEVYDGNEKINTYTIKPGAASGEWATKITTDKVDGTDVQNFDKQYRSPDATKEYTIKMIVHPEIRTGTLVETEMKDANNEDPTSTVYVFTPHVDVHNDTITEAKGYDLTEIPSAITWETKTAEGTSLTGAQLTAAEALLPVEIEVIDDKEVAHRIYPDTTITIETTDTGKPAVTDSNKTSYPISEERHFKVSEINVSPLPFTYEVEQPVEYVEYDENGNPTENKYTEIETVTHFVNVPNPEDPTDTTNRETWSDYSATYGNGKATFMNTDDNRTTGDFTIFYGNYFDMSVDKHFTGGYANLQKVTITATPIVNSNPVTADAKSVVFDVSDFDTTTYEANAPKTISGLEADKTYLITETFDAGDGEKAKYKVLYTVTENNIEVADADNDLENKEFKLVKGNNDKTVSVLVTNEAINIPVTGYSENDTSTNILLIVLAATATLSAGGYGVYRVYHTKKED